MNAVSRTLFILCLSAGVAGLAHAADHKDRTLPPGLQKNVDAGKSLPPGWRKKLAVGETLDHDVYEHATVVTSDDDGFLTIQVEGQLIEIIENTHEIVEIIEQL